MIKEVFWIWEAFRFQTELNPKFRFPGFFVGDFKFMSKVGFAFRPLGLKDIRAYRSSGTKDLTSDFKVFLLSKSFRELNNLASEIKRLV